MLFETSLVLSVGVVGLPLHNDHIIELGEDILWRKIALRLDSERIPLVFKYIGKTMKNIIYIVLISVVACTQVQVSSQSEGDENTIVGTWQLLSAQTIVAADTTVKDYTIGMKGIKMLNEGHFAFFQHDLNKGADSLARYVSGGGQYSYVDGAYTENLEYCTARQWEGHTFDFTLTVSGDTLIQEGREIVQSLGVDRIIRETYVRVD